MATGKQAALEIVGSLPTTARSRMLPTASTRQLLEEAREDFDDGRVFTQAEVEREAAQWLEP